jgi:branched-chain amino acid transport system substrate-binding protein
MIDKNIKRLSLGIAAAALLAASPAAGSTADAAKTQFFPMLVYRTGPYAPNGIPIADGMADYFKYVNAKGGINGTKITWEECETGYNTKKGVECYERLKEKHPVIVSPYSTGITYQLIPKAPSDKIVIYSMGYGRTDASDGRVFPWVFTAPTTYWSQASALVKYIGGQEGGMNKLKGQKIALLYHNSAYGKEPIPTLKVLAKKFGYKLSLIPLDPPGQEQGAAWLQVRRLKPNWILLWGWGVMNQVAIKDAVGIGFPMDHMIGNWWSGSEQDVTPAGESAKGYKAATFHAPGADFPLHKDLLKLVYDKGNGTGKKSEVGTVLWNRGMLNALIEVEAVRNAQKHFHVKVVNGDQMRWAMAHLNITEKRLAQLGLKGFTEPIHTTCADHEGDGPVLVQQWTGKKWKIVSKWIKPMRKVVRPMIEASAAKYAKENNITPRTCK